METIVGIVDTQDDAGRVASEILRAEPRARVRVLTPSARPEELANLPTDDAEQPGMGGAIGAVAGGATGAAAASLLVPPVGAIAMAGIAAAALLGGLGGMATGNAIEEAGSFGLPRDELFLYANALHDGRCVVIAWVDDDAAAKRLHGVMEAAHVESIDAAREGWWVGLRDEEALAYGDRFGADEGAYRRGFEAACRRQDAAALGAVSGQPAFKAGYARGLAYLDAQMRDDDERRAAADERDVRHPPA
jgi:hypothetical protein